MVNPGTNFIITRMSAFSTEERWAVPTFNPRPEKPIEYTPVEFPFRPELLFRVNAYGKVRSEADGEALVQWLRDIETDRTAYSWSFFANAGCTAGEVADPRESCAAFDRALHGWLRRIYSPGFDTYWTNTLLPDGWPAWPSRANDAEHDFRFERFEVSISLDIALWVMKSARRTLPSLEWELSRQTFGSKDPRTGYEPLSYLPTVAPGPGNVLPVTEVRSLVGQVLSRLDSISWQKGWERYSTGWTHLGSLYDSVIAS